DVGRKPANLVKLFHWENPIARGVTGGRLYTRIGIGSIARPGEREGYSPPISFSASSPWVAAIRRSSADPSPVPAPPDWRASASRLARRSAVSLAFSSGVICGAAAARGSLRLG